jgi:four helix bundle protein
MNNDPKYDLEERLITFAANILKFTQSIFESKGSNHLTNQLIRSVTSPALNYGEAQAAESRKDFIHKIQIVLKELRETIICMKILEKSNLVNSQELLEQTKNETNELISIFVKSINTAKKNITSK